MEYAKAPRKDRNAVGPDIGQWGPTHKTKRETGQNDPRQWWRD